MEDIFDKLPIMIFWSSIRRTGGKIADSVSLGRDSNRDPDLYRTNLIITDNNDTTSSPRMIEDDYCKLGDGSFSHTFLCKSKKCLFQENLFLKAE